MKQIFVAIGAIIVLIAAAGGVYLYQQQRIDELQTKNDTLTEELAASQKQDTATDQDEQENRASHTSEKGVAITVMTPENDSTVKSPLVVSGTVPGSWSHEGQFTVRLLAKDGTVLAEQAATLNGDWMTDDMVPFSATLVFTPAAGATTGSLVLVKANPSDMPEHSDSLTIPVRF